jgi:hypothetical protein
VTAPLTPTESRVVKRELLRLDAKAWGIAMGLVAGLTLFFATAFAVRRGGLAIAPHLALLAAYLPGYRVTIGGALVGFVYMFVIGYALGEVVGRVYNLAAGDWK